MKPRKRKIWCKRTVRALKRTSALLLAGAVVLGQLPQLTAFEGHVVNVTARIYPRCEEVAISGTKFDDRNGNGARDSGEPGLPNWIIELKRGPYAPEFDYNGNGKNDSNDYGVLEDVIVDGEPCPAAKQCDFNGDGSTALPSGDLGDFQDWLASRDLGNQVTDEHGNYRFGNLTFGDYILTEVVEQGWTPTTDPRRALTLQSCETDVDFGNQRAIEHTCGNGVLEPPELCDDGNLVNGDGCSAQCTLEDGSISGYKWHDRNRDGVWQQSAEPAIAGWGVMLTGAANASTATDGNGFFRFAGLDAGAYTVSEEERDGWVNSTPTSTAVALAQGEQREQVNFGNYPELCEGAVTLNFDTDASGSLILAGQFIDEEYAPWGIHVRAHNYNEGHPQAAIAFDSSNPTGGDVDLGTPNKLYGGPGDSENGDGTEASNSQALHNLAIIPENATDANGDGRVDDPNDEPAGGSLRFIFDAPMAFASVKYVDLDHNAGEVVGYANASGTTQLFSIPVPARNGNSVQKISGDQFTGIRMLKLRGRDSYGVDEVVLCPIPPVCGDGQVNQPQEQCDDGNLVNGDGCSNDCTTSAVCGNGVIEPPEACDDGNLADGDGCQRDCTTTTWCGDGTVQTPNSYGSSEQCDDGELNGAANSRCTTQCAPKAGECQALSKGYYLNHDGCPASSVWADEVNVLSDSFFDVFVTLDGPGFCQTVSISECPSGSTVEGQRCRAKAHALADEANVVSSRLRLDALLAGADDGNAAFDHLGLTPTSTVQQALGVIEGIIANGATTRDDLARAAYVAARIYNFYENEHPNVGECVLPGLGNGVAEPPEQCDDGDLAPWDGCAPDGTPEVVLNEIMANPVGVDDAPQPGGEWVELYNRAARSVPLDGWVLYDVANSHELFLTAGNTDLATTTIAASGRLVVYRNGDSDFNLNNGGDMVRLFNDEIRDGGALLDQFVWTTEKPEGNSYARVPDGVGDWVDPCPTPGDGNVSEPCDGEPVEAVAQQTEPADEVEPTPDAADLTDEEWNTLFPIQDYPVSNATAASGGTVEESKTEEMVSEPLAVVGVGTGSTPETDEPASSDDQSAPSAGLPDPLPAGEALTVSQEEQDATSTPAVLPDEPDGDA